VGATPNSWADILAGGRRIRLLHEKPVGFSLAPEHNANVTMRAIMYSFGASEQDEGGNPTLRSKSTLEAINYVRALFEQGMTREVLTWDGASNNRFMLTGEGCLTLDSISIARASENMRLPVADDLRLARAPEGPAGRFAPSFGFFTYVIWKFAENQDGARRFLVDLVDSSRQAFAASGFQNMPSFAGAVPDLAAMAAGDSDVGSSLGGKYAVLGEVPTWTANVGHPGHTSPAIGEVFGKGLISTMFADAATGRLTPEEALDRADREVRHIFERRGEGGPR